MITPPKKSIDDTQCRKKQSEIVERFKSCKDDEARYLKIIEMGKENPAIDPKWKEDTFRVHGCQSAMYLHSFLQDGKVFYEAESDALISSGLARLLLEVYSGESAEVILTCPPDYLNELGIFAKLTPSRANGLYSMHLRIRQDALAFLTKAPPQ